MNLLRMMLVLMLSSTSVLAAESAAPARPADIFAQPRPASTLFTPAAANCNVSACQADCTVENNNCSSRQGGGCSASYVNCMQSCVTDCH